MALRDNLQQFRLVEPKLTAEFVIERALWRPIAQAPSLGPQADTEATQSADQFFRRHSSPSSHRPGAASAP